MPDVSAFATMMEVVERSAYPFQVSVDQLIGVEVTEAMRDTNQLGTNDENP